jgi:hypothetical protein
LHVLGFLLIGWGTRNWFQGPGFLQPAHTSRLYALQYLVLAPSEAKPNEESRRLPVEHEAQPSMRHAPTEPEQVTQVTSSAGGPNNLASPPVSASAEEDKTDPSPSSLQVHELPPGGTSGVGQVFATTASNTSGVKGVLGKLGFRVPGTDEVHQSAPGPDEIGTKSNGLDRAAELVSGTSSACPELRPPAAWSDRRLAVAVAFVVDTAGTVDRGTLRVVESPGRPQTDRRFQSHVYVVGAAVRPDPAPVDPARYDSVVTHDVASHVVDLVFRPALKQGRPVRSSVLISCQTAPG